MVILDGIKACVFDAYGTLFDVHSSVRRYRGRLGDHADRISATWRQKQLEYTWLRSLMGQHADFEQVTGDALDYTFDTFSVNDDALKSDLLAAYWQLDCYPEVHDTLANLKSHGLRSAILSNGSPRMLESAIQASDLGHLLDEIFSVESVGIYKPAPAVYQLAVDRLGVLAHQIAFQSSNAWDIAGAAGFGYRAVWVNRFTQPREYLPYGPEIEIQDLSELPAVLRLPGQDRG